MPPNNSNSTSALSRQMRRLRLQVDRIDRQILSLLQQRTSLSVRIGETKRRHRAVIYVPERESELLARVARRSNGALPPRAVVSIYREILSSSRAAQGQAPIGVLRASAERVLLPARWCFGACDQFSLYPAWSDIASRLASGALALALLTGTDLTRILQKEREPRDFAARFSVVGDFAPGPAVPSTLAGRIFIVTPRRKVTPGVVKGGVILIECKSTVNAVKSWVIPMSDRPLSVESIRLSPPALRRGTGAVLARLTLPASLDATAFARKLLQPGREISLLGVYPGPESYGG